MAAFDLNSDSVRLLNRHLHASPSAELSVSNPGGRHCIACGIVAAVDVSVDGHVGYYCAGMNKNRVSAISRIRFLKTLLSF